ncbi:MAG: hypothetical protein KJ646_02405 [Nanoarchaeota archaeon]|nr:hypothetical protein [Nanoarchaeota archaeon]
MENLNQDESFKIILEYLKSNHEALKLLWQKIDILEKKLTEKVDLDFKKKLEKKKIILSDEERKKRRDRWNKMMEEARKEYPNAWKSWKESQDKELLTLHNEGKSIEEITKIMGRNPNSITMRLENKHGIVMEDPKNE